ncbi:type VI secretion system baseplate subunit TssG [Sulfurimonas lithotrophica]|uniref:type VI secretion system baseplate subunit TssG n=1 Tax=Sulfurimonas lithotrophica TaxID=2590022 RepID=UPI00165EFB7F|nr:type VI secretion system baseplate subunit TssG [Sulfurimonas lithotrophica]
MINISDINHKLASKTNKYSLPQAMRVVFYYLKKIYSISDYDILNKKIRFQGNYSLAFQKGEVHEIEFFEDEISGKRVVLTVNFLSLFGSSSPLPSHYSELVLRSFEGDRVLYDFLNIFNNNIQRFIYPIWEKQRYYIKYKKDLNDGFSKYLLAMLGLYANFGQKQNRLNFRKIMPYIGVLSMRQKSAGTITSILRHYLGFNEIEIIQSMKMSSEIPSWQYSKLGKENIQLGVNLSIGEFLINKTSKFRILLKNVTVYDMFKYSVHGNKMGELNDLISFAFNEPLDYDVCMEIEEKEKIKCVLNKTDKRYIGINCWIGEPQGKEQIVIAQKG